MFYKQIDMKKRGEMIAFLKNHFRYNAMNSWNNSTSYANNIKLYNIDKPPEIDDDTCWQMLDMTEWHERLSDLLEEFGREHNWHWQAGINGRSGGYIVLYSGGIKSSGYESYCTHCGQKNYQAVSEGQTGICGRCEARARINFKQAHMQVFTWPGRAVDMHEDYSDWQISDIRQRVKLVQEFDKLCDCIVDEFFDLCKNYRVTEEQILVPKTIKVLEPVG